MHIIKLPAIDSTNSYLKELTTKQTVDNFTVVVAENQTNGRGQRGANWEVENGKNLTFSVLIKDVLLNFEEVFNLNVVVAVSLFQTFSNLKIPNLAIKWANDILADKKKICGILIENQFKSNSEILSIIGIGINVNQENFSNLPQASSLKNISGQEWSKEEVLLTFLNQFQNNINLYKNEGAKYFWEVYHENLFKKNVPMAFENASETKFMGIIKQVLPNGLLQIELEDDSLQLFDIKEVKMLY
ncbi:biotin--[acetyl-CoA-carboxylase] ligase [Flavobacterium terrigena]|uniref:BirA family transcriptional regulator, biotin operon repressor / biotin-[acetyl-CoA-carboxylase] ligase n=1 Tax=Flavobacterium terrigena TaxID=402734 RepID=A0A1H6RZS0_9FLAO|nr:biotin--[acetyl-CoA-carboxylase] ligase [Flavobacterium terrigena]SEI56682.1 BirA family transcriptional regulator, biotin operon repressor / biotin-[acetyl-CoA-carboxylase] ligase [Flavobacterium terrigena]